jgi:hypothetical protein
MLAHKERTTPLFGAGFASWLAKLSMSTDSASFSDSLSSGLPEIASFSSLNCRRYSVIGRTYPHITRALPTQLLAFASDGLPAMICENDSCKRYFVRQQGRSAYGQSRTVGVRFYSSLCARASAQRQYRRRRGSTEGP